MHTCMYMYMCWLLNSIDVCIAINDTSLSMAYDYSTANFLSLVSTVFIVMRMAL